MATHSLPSQAFHGVSAGEFFAPISSLFARWSHPRPARPVAHNAAEAARQVREYASQLRERDPRMAAELMAAADRHELLHGER